MQGVRSGARKELEERKSTKNKLLQDHHHQQQQSTNNQPSQDHLQQITTFLPFQDQFFHKINTMAQINNNWTAPTFSFDSADQPTAWRDFYYRATDYLESLRINPKEEDQQKKGWDTDKINV